MSKTPKNPKAKVIAFKSPNRGEGPEALARDFVDFALYNASEAIKNAQSVLGCFATLESDAEELHDMVHAIIEMQQRIHGED